MPSFNNIDNGESGLSVRNTLNDVINYVNTGITSGSSFTYITEDTTPGSEFVNILSPRDVYISGGTSVELEYYGSPSITSYLLMDNTATTLHTDNVTDSSTQTLTPGGYLLNVTGGSYSSGIEVINEYSKLQSGGGVYSSSLQVNADGTIQTTSTDGTNTSTQTLTPSNITSIVTDGTNDVNIGMDISTGILLDYDESVTLFSGTSNAYPTTLQEIKGSLVFNLVGVTATTYFNSSDNIVVYFTGDGQTYLSVDLSSVSIITSPAGTQLIVNGSGGMSNTYVGQGCYVFNPTLGGAGTETIPSVITDDYSQLTIDGTKIGMSSVDGINVTSFELDPNNGTSLSVTDGTNTVTLGLDGSTGTATFGSTDGTDTSTQTITPQQIVLYATDGTNESFFDLDPANYDYGNRWLSTDGTNTATVELDVSGVNYGNRLYATDGTNESSITFNVDGSINISSDDNGLPATTSEILIAPLNTTISSTDGTNTSTQTILPTDITSTVTDGSSYGRVGLTSTNSYLQLDDDGNTYVGGVDFTYNTFLNNTITGVLSASNITGSSQSLVTTFTNLDTDTGSVSLQSTDGVDTNVITILPSITNFSTVPAFDDDTAASGLTTGDIYQTTGGGASPLDVAGILMIKQ
jgi:hypothetical protein